MRSNLLPASASGPVPFDVDELTKFIRDVPCVTEFLDQKTSISMNQLVGPDRGVIFSSPTVARFLEDSGWVPERFTYIFGHVMTGAVMRDMGGTGEGRLTFMKKKREELLQKMDVQNARHHVLLKDLNSDIDALTATVAEAESIPKSELILMWERRDDIERSFQQFRSKITITRTQRPNF